MGPFLPFNCFFCCLVLRRRKVLLYKCLCVVWMAIVDVLNNRKSCKTYDNTAISSKSTHSFTFFFFLFFKAFQWPPVQSLLGHFCPLDLMFGTTTIHDAQFKIFISNWPLMSCLTSFPLPLTQLLSDWLPLPNRRIEVAIAVPLWSMRLHKWKISGKLSIKCTLILLIVMSSTYTDFINSNVDLH